MTATIVLQAGPAVGVDQPYELLQACHERVERTLALLERLAGHLQTHGADAPARQAAADVLRYFEVAAPAHHDDEERHVFPLIEARGTPAQQLLVAQLRREHDAMRADWPAVQADLRAVTAGQPPSPAEAPPIWARWQAWSALYRAHLAREDQEAFPVGRALVDDEGLRRMSEDMAARRGAGPTAGRGPV